MYKRQLLVCAPKHSAFYFSAKSKIEWKNITKRKRNLAKNKGKTKRSYVPAPIIRNSTCLYTRGVVVVTAQLVEWQDSGRTVVAAPIFYCVFILMVIVCSIWRW